MYIVFLKKQQRGEFVACKTGLRYEVPDDVGAELIEKKQAIEFESGQFIETAMQPSPGARKNARKSDSSNGRAHHSE